MRRALKGLAVIIGTSIVGTLAHRKRATVDDRLALVTGLSGVPAAVVSTYVVTVVPDRVVVGLFSLLLVYTATRMVRTASH